MENMAPRFETFNKRLVQITREIQRIRIYHMKKYDLSGIHLGCLIALNRNKEMTVKQFMDVEVVDKAQISRALNDLIKKNYVAPVPGQTGKYKIKYMLTGSGRILAGELNQVTSEVVSMAVEGVGEQERDIMYQTLDKIYQNLTNVTK